MSAADTTEEFDSLLELLKRTRGFDFTGYKRASLMRRVRRRMQMVGVSSFSDYVKYLKQDPGEFDPLFNTVLINVTTFFRDGVPWGFLSEDIVPRVLEKKNSDEPIRVWSAGCATGQEPYTLTMVLAESLGVDAFLRRVKIYATDVDDEALSYARQGSYTAKEVEPVPELLRERYLERVNGRYSFRKNLRRCVIFGRNDLIDDAPISKIDLLVCRNTLMYFDSRTQERILSRFHFALRDGGFLFLGKAETLATHSEDRKSTRLNSSHSQISYAVFCLKKKITKTRLSGQSITCRFRRVFCRIAIPLSSRPVSGDWLKEAVNAC